MTRHKRHIDVRGFHVMKAACATCPFTTNSLGAEATALYLKSIVTFQAQHTCHSVNDTKICRGGQDIMLRAMHAMGLLEAPTDQCFEQTSKRHLGNSYVPPGGKKPAKAAS